MIEAVNSVLSNAPLVRNNTEQVSASRSIAANPEQTQQVARAPYVSPYIFVDVNLDKAVLQIRDSDTGDVVRTIPSQTQIEAYRKAQVAQRQAQSPQQSQEPAPQVQAESPVPQQQLQTSATQAQQVSTSVSTEA